MNEFPNIPVNWIQIAVSSFIFILSGLCAVMKVGYDLAQHEKRLEQRMEEIREGLKADYVDRLRSAEITSDSKVSRVYQRFDEYKNMIENSFVRRDVCQVMHQSTAASVTSLASRIDGLESKIDELKTILLKFLNIGGNQK